MNLYDQILNTPIPNYRSTGLRKESLTARAAAIRALLKLLKIKGISVTAPRYSMAQAVDIRFPSDPCPLAEIDPVQVEQHDYASCPNCQRKQVAKRYLGKIILGAYPDLDDRSDSQSDHFDYCLSIR